MAVTTTNLGVITAYGDAVAAGYTGTKAEWQALMASYATVGQQAVDAKNAAVAAKDTAVSKATEATTAATTATTKANEASASAQSIAQSAAQIQENTDDIEQLKSESTALTSDGVVPSAEQILTDKGITDSVPYHYRKTGGDGADRLYDQIVGGTVCFNQIAPETIRNGGNPQTVDTKANLALQFRQSYSPYESVSYQTITAPTLMQTILAPTFSGYAQALHSGAIKNIVLFADDVIEVVSGHKYFWSINLTSVDVQTVNGLVYKDNMLIDLTAMFGSTIADYIHQIEQTHAGDGVAFFKALFPNDYYPYNAGELISVSGLSEHKMVGFNQWDEEVENGYINPQTGAEVADSSKIRMKNYIPVLPNTAYYKKMGTNSNGTAVQFWNVYFDKNKNYIGRGNPTAGEFTTPVNCHYIRSGFEIPYGTTYNHDICINISDPTKNGTYEPYKAHSYPLDSDLTLRGIPKLVDGKIKWDGDVYEYTGKVTRNTILRAYQSGDESLANAITDGTNTVVYSANASTEQADPYQHLQQCDPNGTEEYVSTGIVPIGHNSFYPENLRAKVEQLPWNFANLIAPTESAFVATRNYTTGSLFIVSNVLYKATSNIANGGTITPSTNCTATTLAEIISALA